MHRIYIFLLLIVLGILVVIGTTTENANFDPTSNAFELVTSYSTPSPTPVNTLDCTNAGCREILNAKKIYCGINSRKCFEYYKKTVCSLNDLCNIRERYYTTQCVFSTSCLDKVVCVNDSDCAQKRDVTGELIIYKCQVNSDPTKNYCYSLNSI